MKLSISLLAFSASALLFISPPSSADSDSPLTAFITASRIAQTVDETLAPVTVLTEQDIEQSQATSLPDLLRDVVPGIDVVNSGGTGQTTSVFIRGTNSSHFTVLIDGVVAGSATTGTTTLEWLPLEQIKRIEIVRGARSAYYGANAIGGVIQIFTTQPSSSNTTQHSVKLSTGSYNTTRTVLNMQATENRRSINIGLSSVATDGFDTIADGESDNDAYHNATLNAAYSQALDDSNTLKLHFLNFKGAVDYDGMFQNENQFEQSTGSLAWQSSPTNDWSFTLSLSEYNDHLESFLNGTAADTFDTQRQQLNFENNIRFGNDTKLVLGLDRKLTGVNSTVVYSSTENNNSAMYAGYLLDMNRFSLELAIRAEDNEAFGAHNTGTISAGYSLNGNYRLIASHGTAFKEPTFNDLYYQDPYYVGNPDLLPETSSTTELGMRGDHVWGQWEVNVFQTRINDLIGFETDPVTYVSTSVNTASASIDGAELISKIKQNNLTHQFNYTYIDPVDDTTGLQLIRRAKQTLKYSLSEQQQTRLLALDVLAQDRRFVTVDNTESVAGYAVINLRATEKLNKHWDLSMRLDNILGTEYASNKQANYTNYPSVSYDPYNSAGRAIYVTLSFKD